MLFNTDRIILGNKVVFYKVINELHFLSRIEISINSKSGPC